MKRSIANFSLKEERLLSLIPVGLDGISSTELASRYYADDPQGAPLNAQKIIIGRMDTIGKKLAHNGDARRLRKSKRAGPHPIEFWLETATS